MALSLTFSPKARLKPLLNDLDEYPRISKQAKSNQLLMRKNLHLKHRQIMCEITSGDGFLIGDPKFSHLVSSSGLILPEDYVRDLGLGEHGHVIGFHRFS